MLYPLEFKAAILYNNFQPLKIKKITFKGPLKKGQILIKLNYSGICGKQIDEIKGIGGKDAFLPHLLGHEGSGVVKDIGPGVMKAKKNDKVVLHWIKGSGIQSKTPDYYLNDNKINAGWITTFNEYAVVSENRVTKIVGNYSMKKSCLFGCVIPTSFGLVKNEILKIEKLKKTNKKIKIVIFGSGSLGLLIIKALRFYFNNLFIVAVDIKNLALKKSKQYGADIFFNFSNKKSLKKFNILAKELFDYTIVTTNQSNIIEKAAEILSENGVCYLMGVPERNKKMKFNGWEIMHNRTIKGCLGGNCNPDKDLPYFINLDKKKKIDISKIISTTYKFNDINKAINYFRSSKNTGRVIIKY